MLPDMNQNSPRVIDTVIPAFNALPLVGATVAALLEQQLPAGYSLTITVVDDGSSDGTENYLKERFGDRILIIRHDPNRGRSAACNTGAEHGAGEFLLFLDSDCLPANNRFIQEHIHALEAAAKISCGLISSEKQGFWPEYQRQLVKKRLKGLDNTDAATSFTTANTVVARDCFEKAGGFNTSYTHYGFEDRDLLLRLQQTGASVHYTPAAAVNHDDDINLSAVCNKMRLSGRYSSRLFAEQHPESYRTMPYYRFDGRLNPWMRYISPVSSRALPYLTALFEPVLEVRWIPVGLRGVLVRLASALAYLEGTCKS